MFWPNFNSALVEIPSERKNAIFNTYYALAVSAVTAISVSALANHRGKIDMVRRGQHLGLLGWTHTLTPPPHQPHGLRKSTPGHGALSCSVMEPPQEGWLTKHWTIGNGQMIKDSLGAGPGGKIKSISIDIKQTQV